MNDRRQAALRKARALELDCMIAHHSGTRADERRARKARDEFLESFSPRSPILRAINVAATRRHNRRMDRLREQCPGVRFPS